MSGSLERHLLSAHNQTVAKRKLPSTDSPGKCTSVAEFVSFIRLQQLQVLNDLQMKASNGMFRDKALPIPLHAGPP